MKEIVFISGKGGTGKTSMVASIAVLAKHAVIVDCDVDAANLYLLMNPQLKRTIPYSGSQKATIDPHLCSQCGQCQDDCHFEAIVPNPYRVNPFLCEGCGMCVRYCPEKAITLHDHHSGEWYESVTSYGPFYHAQLGIAEETTGKLVSLLRREAKAKAETDQVDYMLTDGSPGIGCPVISSITQTDLVVIVTEPTLSGVHDLKRVIELAEHFSIPMLTIINKYDISQPNANAIEKILTHHSIPLIGRIPYAPVISQAQIQGIPFVEANDPVLTPLMQRIWQHIKNAVNNEKENQS